jgi:enoyl-CoA hydratase
MEPLVDVIYETEGPLALITMNRPQYKNAQSYPMLDSLDRALDMAMEDSGVKIAIVTGAGDSFSAGHDLGTPEQAKHREEKQIPPDGIGFYDSFRHYNMDLNIKWRNLPKPTIAMVRGYCIFGGWMIASSMDLVFADESAKFLASQFEYFSVPWDVGMKKAKELLFESRFIAADEAKAYGFVNRVYSHDDLERETRAYALRCAENSMLNLRYAKLAVNHQQDIQGYSASMETGFADYLVRARLDVGASRSVGASRRLGGVDLAVRGARGERPGLQP